MVYLHDTRCVSSCQRGEDELPSQHVQAYPPGMTMGSDVSWDVHGDYGMPSRGDDVSSVSTSETSTSLVERMVPHGIQTQQKSAEPAPLPIGQAHRIPGKKASEEFLGQVLRILRGVSLSPNISV